MHQPIRFVVGEAEGRHAHLQPGPDRRRVPQEGEQPIRLYLIPLAVQNGRGEARRDRLRLLFGPTLGHQVLGNRLAHGAAAAVEGVAPLAVVVPHQAPPGLDRLVAAGQEAHALLRYLLLRQALQEQSDG